MLAIDSIDYQSAAGFLNGFEIGRRWNGMAAEYGTFGEVVENVISDGSISQQHELFDQAVCLQHRFADDVDGIVRFVADLETDFRTGQRQSSAKKNKKEKTTTNEGIYLPSRVSILDTTIIPDNSIAIN